MQEKLSTKAYLSSITAKVQHMQKVQRLQSLPNPILITILIYLIHALPKIELI